MGKYLYINSWNLLVVISVLLGEYRRNESISLFDYIVSIIYLLFWLANLFFYIKMKREKNEDNTERPI